MTEDRTSVERRVENLSPQMREVLKARLQGTHCSQRQIVPRDSDEPAPLSYAQEGLYFLEKFSPGLPEYNVPLVYRLKGALEVELLREALDRIVARHEALRSCFISDQGEAFQRIAEPAGTAVEFVDMDAYPEHTRLDISMRHVDGRARQQFDLSSGKLFNAVVYRLDPQDHILCLAFHHIVFDGWSIGVFFRELSELYNGLMDGREPHLPPLEIQFGDYASWQRKRWKAGDGQGESLAFWRDYLSEPLPLLMFLNRREASATASAGGCVSGSLESATVAELEAYRKQKSVTLFAVLLAAWKLLLYRYSGDSDILVGTAVSGRQNAQLENLIGHFVNTLPLRTTLSRESTFSEVVSSVYADSLEMQEHQEVPFERLVSELQPTRVAGRVPIIQNMFVLQNAADTDLNLKGLNASEIHVHNAAAKFPLSLMAREESNGRLRLDLEYARDVFDEGMADRMLVHFRLLLEDALTRPDAAVTDLRLLTTEEEYLLLAKWNDTSRDYPRAKTVAEVFEEQASAHAQRDAVVYGEERYTFAELDGKSNQVARVLSAMGLRASSLVALALPRSADAVLAMLGILKAGCAYLPMDPEHPRLRNKGILDDALPALLIARQEDPLLTGAAESGTRTASWEAVLEEALCTSDGRFRAEGVTGDSLAYVMYTSGSTGKPKGVCIAHRGILRLVLNTNFIELKAGLRIAQATNLTFDVSTFEIWGSLLNGGTLYGIQHGTLLSPQDLSEQLAREPVDVLCITPGLFNHVISREPAALSTVGTIISAGESPSAKWVREMLRLDGFGFINAYGPTECTTYATWHEVTQPPAPDEDIPIGLPIANTSAHVFGAHGCLLPINIPGELYLGGDGVALGYLNAAEETARRFVPDPFQPQGVLYKTGDIVKRRQDGVISFLGRDDTQVKIRGFRIELGEIEATACRFPGIRVAAAVACDVGDSGKQIICYYAPSEGADVNSDQLRAFLREQLPHYMVPSRYFRVVDLPLNPSGKIDRAKLPDTAPQKKTAEEQPSRTMTDIEQRLLEVWAQVIGHRDVSPPDSFFDVGGNSLLLLRLQSVVRSAFGVELQLRELFEYPTLATQARYIERRLDPPSNGRGGEITRTDTSVLVPVRSEGSYPPFFFVTGAGDVVGTYTTLVDMLGPDQPFYGFPDPQFASIDPSEFVVERLAERYVGELRRVQPSGPYHLGGYSFGAVVAYEMAQQLAALGEEVAALVIVDTTPNSRTTKNPVRVLQALRLNVRTALDKAALLLRWRRVVLADVVFAARAVARRAFGDGVAEYGREPRFKEYVTWSLRSIGQLDREGKLPDSCLASRQARLEMLHQPHIRRLNQSMGLAQRAARRYRFHPMAVKIELFRGTESEVDWAGGADSLGWELLAEQGVNVHYVPGNHTNLFRQPNVGQFARELQHVLDCARMKAEGR